MMQTCGTCVEKENKLLIRWMRGALFCSLISVGRPELRDTPARPPPSGPGPRGPRLGRPALLEFLGDLAPNAALDLKQLTIFLFSFGTAGLIQKRTAQVVDCLHGLGALRAKSARPDLDHLALNFSDSSWWP